MLEANHLPHPQLGSNEHYTLKGQIMHAHSLLKAACSFKNENVIATYIQKVRRDVGILNECRDKGSPILQYAVHTSMNTAPTALQCVTPASEAGCNPRLKRLDLSYSKLKWSFFFLKENSFYFLLKFSIRCKAIDLTMK